MSRWQGMKSPIILVTEVGFYPCAVRITKSSAFHTVGSHLLVSSEIIFMGFNQHYFRNKRDQNRIGQDRIKNIKLVYIFMCVLGRDVKFISYCKPQPKSLKATSLKYLSGQMIQTALHFGKSIWLPRRKNWRGTDVRTGRTFATVRLQMTVFRGRQVSWGRTEVLQTATGMLRRMRVRWEGVRNAAWVAQVSKATGWATGWVLLPSSGARSIRAKAVLEA